MEINPNHPMTQALHDQWHKLAALIMVKTGTDHIVLTVDDIKHLPGNLFISAQELHDGLHIRFVDEQTAYRLAREHGGLPV